MSAHHLSYFYLEFHANLNSCNNKTSKHWSSMGLDRLASCKLQENLIGFERTPVRHAISHFSPFQQEIQRLL